MICSNRRCTEPALPGLARCAEHDRRRRRNTAWARKRRAAALAEQRRTAATCPKRQGLSVCGGTLRVEVDRLGRSVLVCERCERQQRGICRDCPARVEGQIGRAKRCRRCKAIARNEQVRAYTKRHHARVLARSRAAYAKPEVRAARNEYKRRWRQAHPEQVREQKRRYVARHRGDPKNRYNRYHARYRKKHRLHYRELENTKNRIRAQLRPPVPTCRRCGKPTGWTPVSREKPGAPWRTCMRCAWPHQRKERRRVRREAAKRLAADPSFGLPPKPVKIRRPSAPAVRGPEFERLCVTPGCDTVVSHRRKKCTKCRERDRASAERQLASRRGRGRRNDLTTNIKAVA